MAFGSGPQLLDQVILLLELARELFDVASLNLGRVLNRPLSDHLLRDIVLANDLLHLGEGGVAGE